jgi:hypothetical protein
MKVVSLLITVLFSVVGLNSFAAPKCQKNEIQYLKRSGNKLTVQCTPKSECIAKSLTAVRGLAQANDVDFQNAQLEVVDVGMGEGDTDRIIVDVNGRQVAQEYIVNGAQSEGPCKVLKVDINLYPNQ